MRRLFILLAIALIGICTAEVEAGDLTIEVKVARERAGDNRGQIQQALDQTPAEQRAGIRFLVAYMPQRDLKSLSAESLVENVRLAYQAWNQSPWKEDVPEEIFLAELT